MNESVQSIPVEHGTFERDLLARIRDNVKRNNMPYNRAVAGIDWDKVAFDEHTADECRERWTDIQSRLRIHRTLLELLDDAQASRWDPTRLRKARQVKMTAEGAPAKPLSAFLLFCQHMRPKLAKKHPNLQSSELMALMSKKYASAPAAKKEAYRLRAATARTEYNEQMAEFERSHPELSVDQPPKRPRSALELYVRKHPDVPRQEASAAYRVLPAEEKSRYIRKAQRALEKYAKAAEAYHERYPGWKAPATATGVSKKQRRILEEADGVVRKPRRAYDLFLKETASKLDVPRNQRMQQCAELWRAADEATKRRFQQLVDQEKAEYQRYLESLPSEERELLEKKSKRKRKAASRKPVTAKQLFLREKMPTEFDTLSEAEWRRILSRKFAKLSQADKDMYARRAAELSAVESEQDAAADAAADNPPPVGAAAPAACAPLNGASPSRLSSAGSVGSSLDLKPPVGLLRDPLELDESEQEESEAERQDQTPPRSAGRRARQRPEHEEAGADEMVKIYSSPDPTHDNSLSPTYDDGDESFTAEMAAPTPRARKRSHSTASSVAAEENGEVSTNKKKRREEPVEEEEEEEEPPCTAYEWFIKNFRVKSTDGVTPKKLKKKAKKSWNSLSDDERRRVERRFVRWQDSAL